VSALANRIKRFYGYGRVKNCTVRVEHSSATEFKGKLLFKRLWPAQGVREEPFHIAVTEEGWKSK
jgi:hypothetical protein